MCKISLVLLVVQQHTFTGLNDKLVQQNDDSRVRLKVFNFSLLISNPFPIPYP